MTVTAFQLENFMGFAQSDPAEKPIWLELRPITLLFGRNSSGKSAIIRALRLLKQSVKAGTGEHPLAFVTPTGINQGTYKSTVYQQDISRRISFSFRLENAEQLDELVSYVNAKRELVDNLSKVGKEHVTGTEIKVTFAWEPADNEHIGHVVVESVTVSCPWIPEENNQQIYAFSRERNNDFDQSTQWSYRYSPWQFWGSCFTSLGESPNVAPIKALVKIGLDQGFIPKVNTPWLNFALDSTELEYLLEFNPTYDRLIQHQFALFGRILDYVIDNVYGFLNEIMYITPLRPYPERAYTFTRQQIELWRETGLEGFADYLLGSYPWLDTELSNWLGSDHLNLANDIKVEVHVGDDDMGLLSQIFFGDRKTGYWDNIVDVGFGASQVLPILVEALVAKPGSLVIVEQPELHLHPDGQARLADIFIWAANKNKSIFFLETHSENLLLRLRRRLAETSAKKRR